MSRADANLRTGLAVFGVALGMLGLAYASVPLYDLFCRVTGFGGTPKVADATAPRGVVSDRVVRVQFDASRQADLPWKFEPVQRDVRVRLGEEALVFYRATNVSNRPIVGTATFNVSPDVAGPWFNKIQCFCFTEQLLMPGQSVDMPVTFFVDPAMANDRAAGRVRDIVLSYTFFEARTERARQLLSNPSAPVKPAGDEAVRRDGSDKEGG